MRVNRCGNLEGARKLIGRIPVYGLHCRPTLIFEKGSSGSMPVGTRKMVNYA